MAVIDTFLYIGGTDAVGGTLIERARTNPIPFAGASFLDLGKYGYQRRDHKFAKIVPSGDDGVTGGTYNPYWDGNFPATFTNGMTVAASGAGGWVPYHFEAMTFDSAKTSIGVIPTLASGSLGDNWTQGGGGITPMTMIMQGLGEQYGPTGDGFRAIKYTVDTGASTGTNPFSDTGPTSSLSGTTNSVFAEFDLAAAQELVDTGHTLGVKAIIVDMNREDLASQDATDATNSVAALAVILASCRAKFGEDFIFIIILPHALRFSDSSDAPTLPTGLYRTLANAFADGANDPANGDTRVKTYDPSWGEFAQDKSIEQFALRRSVGDVQNPKLDYDTETYAHIGEGIYNLIHAHFFSPLTTADTTKPLAAVALFTDSQGVNPSCSSSMFGFQGGLGINATFLPRSLFGEGTGYRMPGAYIYDDTSQDIDPYNVMTNSAPFGTVNVLRFGPEFTAMRNLIRDKYPDGVVFLKFANGGMTLTAEGLQEIVNNGGTTAGGYLREGSPEWARIVEAKKRLEIRTLQKYGRRIEWVGGLHIIGDNDASQDKAVEYEAQLPLYVDQFREVFDDGLASNKTIPMVFAQTAPHVNDVGSDYGSTHGTSASRTAYRAALANLPNLRENVTVLLDPDGKRYELQRDDKIHIGFEAVLDMGKDFATELIALIDGTSTGGATATTGDLPSALAPFVVELGTGAADANALISVEAADDIIQTYGNGQEWATATTASKQDAIRMMTRWLTYSHDWEGFKTNQDQGAAFPRYGLTDEDGRTLASNKIPTRILMATAIGAQRIQRGDWTPFPDEAAVSGASTETVTVGPIKISTGGSAPLSSASETTLTLVLDLIRLYLQREGGSVPMLRG